MTARMSYTYWSCEPYGRCYIGVRLCPKKYPTPELDIHYLGSYKDKSFKPRHKIILNVFDNHDDAIKEEIELHNAFDVVRNPHFANRAKQTSTGFSTAGTTPNEETRQRLSGVKNHNYGKPRSEYTKQKISESNKGQTRSEKARKKMSEAKRGKPAKNRNQEIWTRYDWIANLYISTEWGCMRVCKEYNRVFCTNHKYSAFNSILGKIIEEIKNNADIVRN